MTARIDHYQWQQKWRKRNRTAWVQEQFEDTASSLLSDLIVNFILYDGVGIIVSLSNRVIGKKHRYRHREYNKQFPEIVEAITSNTLGIATKRKGSADDFGKRRRTELYPGPALVDLVVASKVAAEDFVTSPRHETIILRAPKEDRRDRGIDIDYEDDDTTRRFREEMERINQYLLDVDIAIKGEPRDDNGQLIDATKRPLRRVFTNARFDSCGRLFDGFWLQMGKGQRHDHILIDGLPVTTLDYSQMNPTIMYAYAQLSPPEGDAYTLPGLENWRPGVKKVFNAMVYSTAPLRQFPDFTNTLFPKGVKAVDVTAAIEKRHGGIRHLFYKGFGHHATYLESQVLVRLLMRLITGGIPALPVHDAVVVRRDQVDSVRLEMEDTFRELNGVSIEVREER